MLRYLITFLSSDILSKKRIGSFLFMFSSIGFLYRFRTLLLTVGSKASYNKKRIVKVVEEDYDYSRKLKTLFEPTSKPPRHRTEENDSVDTIFIKRKTIFQQIKQSCKLGKAKFIHVAGSKGKGSTCEYIAAGLRENGYRVGVFTSPHLHTARERIKINTTLISKKDFSRLSSWAVRYLSTESWAVFFDFLFAMALRYFSEQEVDYILLETGIGGRYDTTNIINTPVVTVITSISLDHQALLGGTIEEIAKQKAGIIKENCTTITASSQLPSVLEVFKQECRLRNANLIIVNTEELTSSSSPSPLDSSSNVVPSSSSIFPIQFENKLVATAALQHLFRLSSMQQSSPTSTTSLTSTHSSSSTTASPTSTQEKKNIWNLEMKTFFWPCRMERFVVNGTSIVLDGAHNAHSVKILLQSIRSKLIFPAQGMSVSESVHPSNARVSQGQTFRDLWVVFGAGVEKSVVDMLDELVNPEYGADLMVFVRSAHFKAMSTQNLMASVSKQHHHKLITDVPASPNEFATATTTGSGDIIPTGLEVTSTVGPTLLQVMEKIRVSKRENDALVVVCGSLFVAAEAREFIFNIIPEAFAPNDWVRESDSSFAE